MMAQNALNTVETPEIVEEIAEPKITCPRCDETFMRKENLIAHLKRKNECKTTSSKESRQSLIDKITAKHYNAKTYDCQFCQKKFNLASCKSRHKKICKKNPDNIDNSKKSEASTSKSANVENEEDEESEEGEEIIHDTNASNESNKFEIHDDSIIIIPKSSQVLLDRHDFNKMKQKLQEFEKLLNLLNTKHNALSRSVMIDRSINSTPKANIPEKNVKKNTRIPNSRRIAAWNAHIGITVGQAKCMCCEHNLITQHKFTCGHIISRADGGTIEIENLRPVCDDCNNDMGNENMRTFAARIYNVKIK
jgi:5-methylcytosine-specific restriction endonuclease McrA/uncharacterized C2H2 Zn-finger protein